MTYHKKKSVNDIKKMLKEASEESEATIHYSPGQTDRNIMKYTSMQLDLHPSIDFFQYEAWCNIPNLHY